MPMPREWTQTGDGREMTAGGIRYRAAPGGSSKFFLAFADDEVLGQATSLAAAQGLCEQHAAQREARG